LWGLHTFSLCPLHMNLRGRYFKFTVRIIGFNTISLYNGFFFIALSRFYQCVFHSNLSKVIIMARYILLGKFSLNGVKGVINSSADRASVAKKAVESAGGKFVSYDFTRGIYDFVGIADGLNDATASALKGVVLSSGDFEQIDMLNTYDQSEFNITAKAIMSAGYAPPSES